MPPRVDVVMPTYGEPRHLAAAIASVTAQTFPDWRLTVFDNGPGGGATARVVEPFLEDARVRYRCTGRVLDQRANWTRSVRAAEAPYVAMLHDDDLWAPEVLERRVAFLDAHPTCALVFSSMFDVDEHGAVVNEIPFVLPAGLHPPDAFAPLLLRSMVIGSPTPLVRLWAYKEAGWEFTDTVKNIDWDMWLRIVLRHPAGYLRVRDCERRVHAGSASSATSGYGEEELALVARFEQLVAELRPGVDWPQDDRRRRRANGHLIAMLDAIGDGDPRAARRRLGSALRADPRAVADPRVPAGVAALALGGPVRRGVVRIHQAQGRRSAMAQRRLPTRPADLLALLQERTR